MSHLSDRLILRCLTSEAGQTKDEQLARLAQAIAQALAGNDDEPGSLFFEQSRGSAGRQEKENHGQRTLSGN